MRAERRFQGVRVCACRGLVNAADNSNGPSRQQRRSGSYPQVPQASFLRYPHCPQILGRFRAKSFHRSDLRKCENGTGVRTRRFGINSVVDDEWRAPRRAALTPCGRGEYTSRALRRIRGASRRNSEAYLPAECTEACEDAWIPSPYGHPRWSCRSCRPPSQGPQGSERLATLPRWPVEAG